MKDGYKTMCKSCRNEVVREKRTEPDHDKTIHLNARLKHLYGIDYKQYEAMLMAQGSACKICHALPVKERLLVDHCHKTGRVRGLLCRACNTGLSRFDDKEYLLERAILYLRESN